MAYGEVLEEGIILFTKRGRLFSHPETVHHYLQVGLDR